MMETLTGGMPSLETSEALNMAFMQLKTLRDSMLETSAVNVTAETEDGTIIGRLFGGIGNLIEHTEDAQATPIDVPPVLSDSPDPVHMLADAKEVNQELVREHTKDELEHLTGAAPAKTQQKPLSALPEVKIGNFKI
jgi:hypothetical protein